MATRNIVIDLVKGLCILLVVVGHFAPEESPEWYFTCRSFIYSFHMPVFMSMAGFLYMEKRKSDISIRYFVKKKFMRLMIPYFTISYIIVAIKLLASQIVSLENSSSALSLIRIFYLPEAGYFLWFAYTIFLIFVLVGFFNQFSNGMTILAILSLAIYFTPLSFPREFCFYEMKGMIVYFIFGCVFYKYRAKLPYKSNSFILTLILFHIAFFAISTSISENLGKICRFGMGILATVYLYGIFENNCKRKLSGLFRILGKYGTSIYLFHTIAMGPAKNIMLKYVGVSTSQRYIVSCSVVICIGIMIPIIITKYVIRKSDWAERLLLGEGWK